MVGNDEGLSDLRGGIYTPLCSANLARSRLGQTSTKARKAAWIAVVRLPGKKWRKRKPWPIRNPKLADLPHTTIMVDRAQPVSIETLLQKQREEKEAASRVSPPQTPQSVLAGSTLTTLPQPKFLTKAQRAELALANKNQEEQERKEKQQRERKDREVLEREAEEFRARDRDRNRESRYGSSGTRRQFLGLFTLCEHSLMLPLLCR